MNTCSRCKWYHIGNCVIDGEYPSIHKSPDDTCPEWTVTYHEDTDNMVCPYCGYEEEDSYVSVMCSDGYTCEECRKEYIGTQNVRITYTTKKKEEL
jgi:hypothetical protein